MIPSESENTLSPHLIFSTNAPMPPRFCKSLLCTTINAATCYDLKDRGAISPGLRADLIMFKDFKNFKVDNVWIGGSVTILPGVKIGDNVTIGAGSVVTKDIPSNCVAVGNPCKVVKSI